MTGGGVTGCGSAGGVALVDGAGCVGGAAAVGGASGNLPVDCANAVAVDTNATAPQMLARRSIATACHDRTSTPRISANPRVAAPTAGWRGVEPYIHQEPGFWLVGELAPFVLGDGMTWFGRCLALCLVLVTGCALDAGAPGEDVDPGPEVAELGEELSSLSCSMSTATGYVSGSAFTISVVTVDGKKVEWKTANAYMKMAKAAANAGVTLKVVSGFRTMAEQKYLYSCYVNCSCNSCNLAAKPGYSNHQSGHALDLNTSSGGVYSWLSKNAGKYGFKRTVPSEAWHWEWWGTDPGTGPCNGADKDKDGVADSKDNCPNTKNASQLDTDKDKKGDACDGDDDNDGLADAKDNCPKKKNEGQLDTDGDDKGNACDGDDDGDGKADGSDNCPLDANKSQLDTDKDKKGDACDGDDDNDGLADAKDNCPKKKNEGQLDSDDDGKGDACETDDDDDGIVDEDDDCAKVANADQLDSDGDGKGDACDTDDDDDGVVDEDDVCPTVADPDQTDSNENGVGDACDLDTDADGVEDADDVCADVADPDQADGDQDGVGDACDDDDDGDGVSDASDACPGVDDTDLDACPPEFGDAPPDSSDNVETTDDVQGDAGCHVGPTSSTPAAFVVCSTILALALGFRRRRRVNRR